jgi:hypothetical protein
LLAIASPEGDIGLTLRAAVRNAGSLLLAGEDSAALPSGIEIVEDAIFLAKALTAAVRERIGL